MTCVLTPGLVDAAVPEHTEEHAEKTPKFGPVGLTNEERESPTPAYPQFLSQNFQLATGYPENNIGPEQDEQSKYAVEGSLENELAGVNSGANSGWPLCL